MQLSAQNVSFSGKLLKRGFWLYVWKIQHANETVYYVGRTGDSSSANASSPLNRIGKHFDIRPNARGNTLFRRLKERKLDPEHCDFQMVAVGPLFAEQPTFDLHVPYRNIIATLEHALANYLRNRGLVVLGSHHPSASLDEDILSTVIAKIDSSMFNS